MAWQANCLGRMLALTNSPAAPSTHGPGYKGGVRAYAGRSCARASPEVPHGVARGQEKDPPHSVRAEEGSDGGCRRTTTARSLNEELCRLVKITETINSSHFQFIKHVYTLIALLARGDLAIRTQPRSHWPFLLRGARQGALVTLVNCFPRSLISTPAW